MIHLVFDIYFLIIVTSVVVMRFREPFRTQWLELKTKKKKALTLLATALIFVIPAAAIADKALSLPALQRTEWVSDPVSDWLDRNIYRPASEWYDEQFDEYCDMDWCTQWMLWNVRTPSPPQLITIHSKGKRDD